MPEYCNTTPDDWDVRKQPPYHQGIASQVSEKRYSSQLPISPCSLSYPPLQSYQQDVTSEIPVHYSQFADQRPATQYSNQAYNQYKELVERVKMENKPNIPIRVTTHNVSNQAPVKTKQEVKEERMKYVVRGSSGLKNIGNTCYMNATLQCLSALSLFSSYIRKDQYMPRLARNEENRIAEKKRKEDNIADNEPVRFSRKEKNEACQNTIVCQLARVLRAMWDGNCTVAPHSFKKLVSKLCPIFEGYTQNDSQELLNFVLDRIHEETKTEVNVEFTEVPSNVKQLINFKYKCTSELNQKSTSLERKQQISDSYKKYLYDHPIEDTILRAYVYWKKYIQKSHSVITELFTGLYYSRVICDECNTQSASFEPFSMMSIPTSDHGSTTLNNCLAEFSKEERLLDNNQYKCKHCSKKTNGRKQMFIWEEPEILIIQLKRFKNNGRFMQKTSSNVEFPLTGLSIDGNFSNIHNKTNVKYDLFGVVKHTGSCSGGHYIAYTKNSINNMWYEFDDDDIIHVPDDELEQEIITKDAYILFYVKQKNE